LGIISAPAAAVVGIALVGVAIVGLATGGAEQLVETGERLASGQGTAEDFEVAGAQCSLDHEPRKRRSARRASDRAGPSPRRRFDAELAA
jgi:hypothetical protein